MLIPTVALIGDDSLADAVKAALLGHVILQPGAVAFSTNAPDFVIATSMLPNRNAQIELQNRARAVGAHFLAVNYDAELAVVGPMVDPVASGCLACFSVRLSAARSNRAYYERLERGPTLGPWPGAFPFIPSVHGILAAMVASAVRSAFCGQSSLFRHAFVVSSQFLTGRRHAFQPVPACPHCGDLPDDDIRDGTLCLRPQPKADAHSYRIFSSPPDLTALKSQLLDSKTGIVTQVVRQESSRHLAYVWSHIPSPPYDQHALATGRGFTVEASECVALLEALERYAGCEPRARRTIVRGALRMLTPYACDPMELAQHCFDDSWKPEGYIPFSSTLEMNWVWGYSFRRGRPLLIPETCVYYRLPQAPTDRPHNPFAYEISNGCALGSGLEEAILYGLFEVIERDAFLLAWYSQSAGAELSAQDITDERILMLIDGLSEDGFEVRIFNITTEFGVPSLWVVARNRASEALPALLCAAGAHFDPERALLSALVEIASTLPGFKEATVRERQRGLEMVHYSEKVREMDDHALLYAQPEGADRLSFLLGRTERTSFRAAFPTWYYSRTLEGDLTVDLLRLVERIRTQGQDVWVVNQTPPEAESLGLAVVKVLVTGTLPMTFGHRRRRIAGVARLLNAPSLLGWRTELLDVESVNPLPHPFP